MKKLLLAVVLYAATVGMASATGASVDGAYRGVPGPFATQIFVRGLNSDWGEVNPMTYNASADTYEAVINLTELTDDFKIATADWDTAAWGVTNFDLTTTNTVTALILDQRFGGTNASLSISSGGLYLFSLDVSTFDVEGLNGDYNLTISRVVPVPAAGLLLLSALGGLGFMRRRT